MTLRTRNMASLGASDAAEAVGWLWTTYVSASAPSRRSWLTHSLKAAFGLVVTMALVTFMGFLWFVYSLERTERDPGDRTDGIVALTGGAQRIGDAIDLLAQGYAKRLLISGVNERTSRDEIERLNPGQRRLFDCCVDLDYRARNTIGNAIETRRWTENNQFRSIIVVTSNYHMPRTLVELDHALPHVRKVPYAVVTPSVDPADWWRNLTTLRILASEYVKLLVMWVRTRFESAPERSTAVTGGRSEKIVVEPLPR